MGKINLRKAVERMGCVPRDIRGEMAACASGKHVDEKILGQISENGRYKFLCRCRVCGEEYERVVINRRIGGYAEDLERMGYF